MSKKSLRNPMGEGSLQRIAELFFTPILANHCPPGADRKTFLEDIFDVDHRFITHWECTKEFTIKGLFLAAAHMPIQGIGYRTVPVGAVLTARHNTRRPTSIELEYMGGVGKKEQIFSLSDSEWNWVELHCKPYDKATKPRHRNSMRSGRVPG